MNKIQIISGTQLKSKNNLYQCHSVWMLGNNVKRYELTDKNGFKEVKATYNELHDKIEKQTLVKI